MHKYKVNYVNPIGVGGEGKVLEVAKIESSNGASESEETLLVMKQRICFHVDDANRGLSEAIALARFQHENIVGFEDIFIHNPKDEDSEHYYLCIVMEYCSGGSLFDYLINHDTSNSLPPSPTVSAGSCPSPRPPIVPSPVSSSSLSHPSPSLSHNRPPVVSPPSPSPSSSVDSPVSFSLSGINLVEREYLPRDFLIEWIRQICNGLNAIHKAKLVHRDLKSENIFIANNNVLKIGDFGLATLHKNEKVKGMAGTYYYSSPELLKDKVYDRAGDIFSLGCVIYEMVTLNLLPRSKICFGDEIINHTFNPTKILADFPEDCKDIGQLVLQMLNEEPSKRPHVDIILRNTIFSSPWRGATPSSFDKFADSSSRVLGVVIRQLLVSDAREFAGLMARAYLNDPVFVTVTKSNDESMLRAIFKQAFKMFQTKRFSVWGYFTSSKKLIAASVWVPPDYEGRKPSLSEVISIAFSSKAMLKVGISALRRFRKTTERVRLIATDRDCWHLLYCGVEPGQQNKRIGELLCSPVLQWADQEVKVVTACLFSERPVHFLQKMGFEMQKLDRADPDLPCWYFKRMPVAIQHR